MEDWLEKIHFNYKIDANNTNNTIKYVYLAIDKETCVFLDKYKAKEYSLKNNSIVAVHIETEPFVYKSTGNYYLDGVLHKN